MTWRDRFRPIVAAVIAASAGKTEKEIRAALRAARPLQAKQYSWQKQVWYSEIGRQLGHRRPADRPRRRIASRTLRKLSAAEVREWYAKRQLKLFGGGEV